jgi:hypothetical protein
VFAVYVRDGKTLDAGENFIMTNFISYTLYQILLGKQMKNSYMGGAYSTRGNDDKYTQIIF